MKNISNQQTETEAELLLEQYEKGMAQLAEKQGERIELKMLPWNVLSLRSRLINVLACIPKEEGINKVLESFPALVDRELLNDLYLLVNHANNVQLRERYKSILGIVQTKLSSRSILKRLMSIIKKGSLLPIIS